jgi:tricorn protease-like protein
MDLDAITTDESLTKVISLGADDLVMWQTLDNSKKDQLELPINNGFNTIALHPEGKKFILGGQSKQVCEYDMQTKKMNNVIYESLGKILDMKYSPSGRYISIATEEQKTVVVDTHNNRKTKCRPGHSNRVINTFFGMTDQFVASIG